MDARSVPGFLRRFVSYIDPLFGSTALFISKPLDAAIFPDEIKKLNEGTNGLYIIWSKKDHRVIYVGISTDIPSRIYQHIGKGFSWGREGQKASFPKCTLASGRHWLSKRTQEELIHAEWCIIAVLPTPPEIAGLLESALIYWGIRNGFKPEINVEL